GGDRGGITAGTSRRREPCAAGGAAATHHRHAIAARTTVLRGQQSAPVPPGPTPARYSLRGNPLPARAGRTGRFDRSSSAICTVDATRLYAAAGSPARGVLAAVARHSPGDAGGTVCTPRPAAGQGAGDDGRGRGALPAPGRPGPYRAGRRGEPGCVPTHAAGRVRGRSAPGRRRSAPSPRTYRCAPRCPAGPGTRVVRPVTRNGGLGPGPPIPTPTRPLSSHRARGMLARTRRTAPHPPILTRTSWAPKPPNTS